MYLVCAILAARLWFWCCRVARHSHKLWPNTHIDARNLQRYLQALRESGEKLAQMAADLSAKMAAGKGADAMDAGLARELIELGIVSPVTKQSAGKQYHQQLSRQLAEFLEKHLKREKGMMVLHDVYCLFNRCDRPVCFLACPGSLHPAGIKPSLVCVYLQPIRCSSVTPPSLCATCLTL